MKAEPKPWDGNTDKCETIWQIQNMDKVNDVVGGPT
jgi:hypothetical protein